MAVEMRSILCESLLEAMKANDRIVCIGADLDKANGLFPLREVFPDRAFDVGIAEQNMVGIAAGMASYGMIPVVNTFAAFATRRVCDQIAVSVCYADQNVKIIGTDPGITAELNGGTHMTFEDIGVLRSIPNITIVEPCDAVELARMVPAVIAHEGPVYMRLYRKVAPIIHEEGYQYTLGKADIIKTGTDVTIICSGITVPEAAEAGKLLKGKGIDAEIINIHTIKPIDLETILASARKTGVIVACENHNVLGGLRSAVADVITEHYPVKIYPVGVKDRKGEVGKFSYLIDELELSAKYIVKAAETAVKEKSAE